MLTQTQLKTLLRYYPRTGVFRWRINIPTRPGSFRRSKGKRAGYLNPYGYNVIMIAGKGYHASRLAYLYRKGKWPSAQMDHKNGKPADDRWCNIRPATPSQNSSNRKGKRTKFKGITRVKHRYRAQICVNRTYFHVGYFDTEAEAHAAYAKKAAQLHGEFINLTTSTTA